MRMQVPPVEHQRLLTRPLRWILAWWAISFGLYLTLLPPEWKVNVGRVALILLAVALLVYLGYTRAARARSAGTPLRSPEPPSLLIVASGAFMVMAGVVLATAIGFTDVDSVVGSAQDLGAAYANRKAIQRSSGVGTAGTLLVSMLFFLFPFAIPLAIMSWNAIPNGLKALVVAGGLSYGGYFLAGGTMKGFGDLALLLLIGLLARSSRVRLTSSSWRSVRQTRRSRAMIVAVIAAFVGLVVAAMASRQDAREPALATFSTDGLLGRALGPYWSAGFDTAVGYVAKGYVGLGIATDFTPSYGLYGGFRGVSDLLSRYLGFENRYLEALPFVAERHTGYSATVNWWTVFPWLASDVGWLGAVVLVGLVGVLAGRLWVNIVHLADPLSVGLFYFVATFLVWVPANNQVFLGSSSTIGSLVLLTAYAIRGGLRASHNSRSPERGADPERSRRAVNEADHSPGTVTPRRHTRPQTGRWLPVRGRGQEVVRGSNANYLKPR